MEVFWIFKEKRGTATKANLDMTYAVCRLCFKKYANKEKQRTLKIALKSEHLGESSNKVTDFKTPIQSTISNYVGPHRRGKFLPRGKELLMML